MTRGLLRKAEEAESRGDWREAAVFARAAIENAAKAVVACFTSVPRSHEPGELLEHAAGLPQFPWAMRNEARALAVAWRAHGMSEHILLSYGDERNHIDPWELVTPESARATVSHARDAADFAARCAQAVLGNGP
jgi:HEPN domain-containing protein